MKISALLMLAAALVLPTGSSANDDDDALEFRAALSTAQEVPAPAGTISIERASIRANFNKDLSAVNVRLKVVPNDRVVAAHFHCNRAGLIGPVVFGLIQPGVFEFDGKVARGTLTNADFTGADCEPLIGRPVNNIAALALAMRDGLIYANVHTVENPPGEVRGQMLEDD